MSSPFDVRLESLARAHEAPANSRLDETLPLRPGTFYLETFGCQMNSHDSEKVAGVLTGRGYEPTDRPEEAQLVFYNTCSIREKAAQKVFSRLGLFREREGNGQIIGVLGCVAQQEGQEIFERAPWVSLVCGSASYRKLPELLAQLENGNRRVMGLETDTDETFETELTRRENPFRAYITIIEGCSKACAYCVVPFTRGPERSRASAAVLDETRRLAAAGYSEIQFLGQTVNSYRDPSPRRMTFAELLRAAAEVQGIRRVRFTTSHPSDFSSDIAEAIDAVPALCDHVHLPAQSGSTRILQAMRRTYTREEYLEKIALIRAARRPISITSDIIIGFPGESDEDFADTLSLLDAAQYDSVYAFQFSPRPNTEALHLTNTVPEEERAKRLTILQDRQREIQLARNQALIGQTLEVLVDGAARKPGQWLGRTSSNRMVNFASSQPNLLGQYVSISITSAGPGNLVGDPAASG